MLGLFLGFALYSLLENEINIYFPNKTKKIKNNFLAGIHILNIFLLSFIYYISSYNLFVKNMILFNTCSYFSYDALTFIKTRSFSFGDLVLIYHHLISGLYLINVEINSNWYTLLLYAELSNIPGIFIYHYLQLKKKGENHVFKLKILKTIQLYVYIFIRCVVMVYYMFNEIHVIYYNDGSGSIHFYAILPLFFMGFGWSYHLYNNLQIKEE